LVNRRARRFHDATHNCWAFRVGGATHIIERSSDAGEPFGTAGRPILERLQQVDVVDVVLVVSRWFGGTKLGVGGLLRAYGACAAGTLAGLKLLIVRQKIALHLKCAYDQIGLVELIAARCQGCIISGNYGGEVVLEILIPTEEVTRFKRILREESRGKIRLE